ncbi:hypothetical protein AKI39_14960 [Bordetella sp. H567]|nr:hypothetical protein AKI39_14960 [Bordetella sp. H567]
MAALTAVGAARAEPACDPAQLSFAVDREGGQFDGMSHSGTLLVVRNLGPNTCTVPARPEVGFLDAAQHPLPVSLQRPAGMHPGPVLPPVAVPPGAELTSEARWVSSDAFGAGNCVASAFISLSIRGQPHFTVPLATQLCGPAHAAPSYSLTLLRRDPVYAAPAR